MLNFEKTFKLYVFKDKDQVDWTIRIANNYAHTYIMKISEFKNFLMHWRDPDGFQFQFNNVSLFVHHKTWSPRPDPRPANYVRLTIWCGMGHQYRVNFQDMVDLETDFNYQMNNQMYWDTNNKSI